MITRYAGLDCDDEANNDKVLAEMRESPNPNAGAFPCVLALVGEGLEETFAGACEILRPNGGGRRVRLRSALFAPGGFSTFAEASRKGASSVPGPALVGLIEWLRARA